MANPQGVIHALRKQIVKLSEAIEELGNDIGNTARDLADMQNIIRGLKNPDMPVNGGSVTLDRIQVMENGDIRLLPPPPAPITDRCVQEPQKNGKKPEKELADVSAS